MSKFSSLVRDKHREELRLERLERERMKSAFLSFFPFWKRRDKERKEAK